MVVDRRPGEFSFREHVEQIRARPGMYGLDGSYWGYVVYLLGYDAGTRGTALLGFREWLLLRLDEESSLAWPGLVRELAWSGASLGPNATREERDAWIVEVLFARLTDFLAERDGDRDGLRRIHVAHARRFGR